jgi:hypothetical protein
MEENMHEGRIFTYDFNTSKKSIVSDCEDYARRNSDGGGLAFDIKFEDRLFDNYEKAREYLTKKSESSWYYCGAVQYLEYPKLSETKHYQDLKQRLDEWSKKLDDLDSNIHYANVKASFVSCPTCNSKINREYIKWNYCPICRNDMRPKTTLDTIARYKEIIKDLKKQLTLELEKM